MLLKPEPIFEAIEDVLKDRHLCEEPVPVILTTPQGRPFSQPLAYQLAEHKRLVILCGHYEGVDDRIRAMVDLELSIGDFVLTGGELPALVVCDAVLRLLPGAIEPSSLTDESFTSGLLEYPQYTRPALFGGEGVPEILTSGDHDAVRRWRLRESLRRTLERRPDLLEGRPFNPEEARLLCDVIEERAAHEADAGVGERPDDQLGVP